MVHKALFDNQAITRNMNETDGSLFAVKKEGQGHLVRVARATALQPMFESTVFVNRNANGIVQLHSYTPLGELYACMASCGNTDVLPERPIRILIASPVEFHH